MKDWLTEMGGGVGGGGRGRWDGSGRSEADEEEEENGRNDGSEDVANVESRMQCFLTPLGSH